MQRVVVPYAPRPQPETLAAVYQLWPDCHPELVAVGGDTQAYWRLLVNLWDETPTENLDLVVIEHDIVPHSLVPKEFEDCDRGWCVFPYEQHDAKGPTGLMLDGSLGCVRFRHRFMAQHPNAITDAGRIDLGSGLKHWARLDDAIARALRPQWPHVHEPPVAHLLRPR